MLVKWIMFPVRILAMKQQLDLIDQKLDHLRRLTGRQA